MAVRLAVGLYRDPVRVSVLDVLVGGVGIDARDHVHAEFPAAGDHVAKRVAVAEELTSIVQWDLGRIEGHATARAEADRIGVNAFVVVEPELRFVVAWIVLDEGELGPSHRAVVPAFRGALLLSERGTARPPGHRSLRLIPVG